MSLRMTKHKLKSKQYQTKKVVNEYLQQTGKKMTQSQRHKLFVNLQKTRFALFNLDTLDNTLLNKLARVVDRVVQIFTQIGNQVGTALSGAFGYDTAAGSSQNNNN